MLLKGALKNSLILHVVVYLCYVDQYCVSLWINPVRSDIFLYMPSVEVVSKRVSQKRLRRQRMDLAYSMLAYL